MQNHLQAGESVRGGIESIDAGVVGLRYEAVPAPIVQKLPFRFARSGERDEWAVLPDGGARFALLRGPELDRQHPLGVQQGPEPLEEARTAPATHRAIGFHEEGGMRAVHYHHAAGILHPPARRGAEFLPHLDRLELELGPDGFEVVARGRAHARQNVDALNPVHGLDGLRQQGHCAAVGSQAAKVRQRGNHGQEGGSRQNQPTEGVMRIPGRTRLRGGEFAGESVSWCAP